jgi:hypothetical protein
MTLKTPPEPQFLDRIPSNWFVLNVVQRPTHKRDWCALLIDVHPDDLKNCTVDFPARFYVHPKEHRPGHRTANQAWVIIPGKHKSWNRAWDAIEDLMATRH